MANTIEHKIPAKIVNLVNIHASDYKILEVVGTGTTDYYPCIDKDGNQMSLADYSFEEMLSAKVHRQGLTVTLLVEGNVVSAARFIRQFTGYKSTAISLDHVDVDVPWAKTEE